LKHVKCNATQQETSFQKEISQVGVASKSGDSQEVFKIIKEYFIALYTDLPKYGRNYYLPLKISGPAA
jgi:hypothetical protein